MAGSSFSTERSSVQLRRSSTLAQESYEGTALPQVTSHQLVLSHRRPPRGSESSILASTLRGNYRAAAPLHQAQDTLTRGPNTHRRTGSTLKTVMRKIFTRKRRSDTDDFEDAPSDSPTPQSQTPRSNKDLTEISFLELQSPKSQTPKSSSPLQREYGGSRMIEASSHSFAPALSGRRRATLPSLILSEDGRNTMETVFNTDSARYSRDRSSHANSDQTDLLRRENLRVKRRSRSADALRGMARDHQMSPIQWRRRSTETTYVNSSTFDTSSDSEMSYRPPTRTTVASAPEPPSESPVEGTQKQEELENVTPNIGNLVNCMQHSEDISLEQRLTTLEVKLIDLEFAIARMQNVRAEPSPAESPKENKASSPTKSRRHVRNKSSAHLQSPGTGELKSDEFTPDSRPVSTATIRPSNLQRLRTLQTSSSTSLSDFNGISVEQYSALVMLLRREQTARRNLETQVASLKEDIQQLQQLASNSISVGTMYPIRSRESQELERMRKTLVRCPADSLTCSDKIGSPSDSESEVESPRGSSRDDVFGRPKWQYNRRIEVARMI
ncbi:uncharacterized protein CDV56_101984 [Aspergillus thermomutatus]|uniref:Uncharacterized protein n=1 Tax=Aspergillus thermomutatus TaxID=41047 RepID=A0A397GX86_ASPTH|nr:uncharacterized protein CDV56_101984 [Aspergillus thermomutatus]RHZ54134.1 hypothetical protein CDV56_101984 [Aspergillus thermomutatus]